MLEIYDITGRQVAVLYNGISNGKTHSLTWDGTDKAGNKAGSGVYFARLHAGNASVVRKLVLVK
jgi:flagellar hook assembly protein FlgD